MLNLIQICGWLSDAFLCIVGYPLVNLICCCRIIPPCCFILCGWDMLVDFLCLNLGWLKLFPEAVEKFL